METGTFSLLYPSNGGDGYVRKAVDWDWHFSGQWARSESEGWTINWQPIEGLDEEARHVILIEFELTPWEEEFPIVRLIAMSPGALIEERRKKEVTYNLPKKEVVSATLCYHVRAEEHPNA